MDESRFFSRILRINCISSLDDRICLESVMFVISEILLSQIFLYPLSIIHAQCLGQMGCFLSWNDPSKVSKNVRKGNLKGNSKFQVFHIRDMPRADWGNFRRKEKDCDKQREWRKTNSLKGLTYDYEKGKSDNKLLESLLKWNSLCPVFLWIFA